MTYTCGAQREFAERLVEVARHRLGPLPADLAHRDNLRDRLSGFIFSMFVEMEGAGDLDWHQLTRRGGDGADLTAEHLHELWPHARGCSSEPRQLFAELTSALDEALRLHGHPGEAMRHLSVAFARLIERDFALTPLYEDEDDMVEAGPDIAPGLARAVETAWDRAMAESLA